MQPCGRNRYGPKIRGCAFLAEEGLGPHPTQCGHGRGLPARQVSSWSVQPFGHSARTSQTGQDRTDRQRTDSIGRTVLQTVAQKLLMCAYHCVQLLYTTQHRTVLITFPLILQTTIAAQMMSTGGEEALTTYCTHTIEWKWKTKLFYNHIKLNQITASCIDYNWLSYKRQ